MKKILILAANPTDTNKLRLDEEVREIQAAHRKARNREEIEIISEWAVTVDDLQWRYYTTSRTLFTFVGMVQGMTVWCWRINSDKCSL